MPVTMKPVWRMPGLLLRESRTSAGTRDRVPEPMVMDAEDAVEAFEEASTTASGLEAAYYAAARGVSTMLPKGGQVVDVGCGAGEFIRYLAERRPDCKILGLDLSMPMIERARARAERAGMADRIRIEQADATAIDEGVLPERIDVVTTLNLLHQFPDTATLDRCLQQFALLRQRYDCALWIMDLFRLKHPDTMRDLVAIFEPQLQGKGLDLTLESEAAAWTVDELRGRLQAAGLGDLRLATDRSPGTWQVHWTPQPEPWVDIPVPRQVRFLVGMFRGLPTPRTP